MILVEVSEKFLLADNNDVRETVKTIKENSLKDLLHSETITMVPGSWNFVKSVRLMRV